MLLTTQRLLVSWSWKSRAVPLNNLWATTGPVTGTLYLFIYFFSFASQKAHCTAMTNLNRFSETYLLFILRIMKTQE